VSRPAAPSDDGVDLVVVVASAGGVEALKRLVQALPVGLPAAVLLSLHLPPAARSLLAEILDRRTTLTVRAAGDGTPLQPGCVLVARPDHHLVVVDGVVRLGHGARENGNRPSHDALLRSAALDRGPRVVAAVLTGLLDDGAAGLAAVERYGGACLVQDPAEAEFPSMPAAAARAAPSARVLRLDELVEEVVAVVGTRRTWPSDVAAEQRARDQVERDSALGRTPMESGEAPPGAPSPFGCPDCHGVLNTVEDDTVLRFRCRTGHAWSATSLLAQQSSDVEGALWLALRVLEERAEMCARLAGDAARASRDYVEELYRQRAAEAMTTAAVLRDLLQQGVSREAEPPAAS
jgi:two-component system, chemotaxis family, protein-glutamate methylesterase/glutaminase